MDCLKSGCIVDYVILGVMVLEDVSGNIVVFNLFLDFDVVCCGFCIGDEIFFFGDCVIDFVNSFKNVFGIYFKGFCVLVCFVCDGEE